LHEEYIPQLSDELETLVKCRDGIGRDDILVRFEIPKKGLSTFRRKRQCSVILSEHETTSGAHGEFTEMLE
jgi:hypothetical protein